jgi:hypothetical protein
MQVGPSAQVEPIRDAAALECVHPHMPVDRRSASLAVITLRACVHVLRSASASVHCAAAGRDVQPRAERVRALEDSRGDRRILVAIGPTHTSKSTS